MNVDELAAEERGDDVESVWFFIKSEEDEDEEEESNDDVNNIKRRPDGKPLSKNGSSKAAPSTQIKDLLKQGPEIATANPTTKGNPATRNK